jgi:hypothetical protein
MPSNYDGSGAGATSDSKQEAGFSHLIFFDTLF